MSENYIPCAECGELKSHDLHHDMPDVVGNTIPDDPHTDACNVDGDWQGEERGYVATMDCHEFEEGCYCGERGKCEVCVDQAVENADHLRDAAKEAG